MTFDRRSLVLPDGAAMGEHVLVLPQGDAVVADRASLDFGVVVPGRVFVGERSEVGPIEAKGDIRVDMWTRVKGDLESGGAVFLGERCHVEGRLQVAGDLDVGDDVRIEKGFEARGWINIRNPVPMVIYVFIYLLQLVGQGRSDEVERILKELEKEEDAASLVVDDVFLYVPEGTRLGLEESRVPGILRAGEACRLVGNFRVDDHARLGKSSTLHGSLTSGGDVTLDEGVEVHGDVAAKGAVRLSAGSRVRGGIRAATVEMSPTATVEGNIQAEKGVRFVTPEALVAKEKLEDFAAGREAIGGL